MKDKVALLMEETGCDRGEAELALELCGYDVETALAAVPRLFQSILVFKGRFRSPRESLHGLWLAVLDLKSRSLLRARAVASYNPAVFASELDRHWFDFEARLYSCRLWAGTVQALSQEVEVRLAAYLGSAQAASLYDEKARFGPREAAQVRALLSRLLGGETELEIRAELLDRGQFQELHPAVEDESAAPAGGLSPSGTAREETDPRAAAGEALGGEKFSQAGRRPSEPLVLRVALEPSPEGVEAGGLKSGDAVYACITDGRDVARYLARLLGSSPAAGDAAEGGSEGASAPISVPVEATSKAADGSVLIRVRFSAGLCGEVSLPQDIRLKAAQRPARAPAGAALADAAKPSWWKKFFG
ncbi:MAG: hypothetical protein AAB412_00170 [Elusimicrobiota bacterium]